MPRHEQQRQDSASHRPRRRTALLNGLARFISDCASWLLQRLRRPLLVARLHPRRISGRRLMGILALPDERQLAAEQLPVPAALDVVTTAGVPCDRPPVLPSRPPETSQQLPGVASPAELTWGTDNEDWAGREAAGASPVEEMQTGFPEGSGPQEAAQELAAAPCPPGGPAAAESAAMTATAVAAVIQQQQQLVTGSVGDMVPGGEAEERGTAATALAGVAVAAAVAPLPAAAAAPAAAAGAASAAAVAVSVDIATTSAAALAPAMATAVLPAAAAAAAPVAAVAVPPAAAAAPPADYQYVAVVEAARGVMRAAYFGSGLHRPAGNSLVFDTETTGLNRYDNRWQQPHEPHRTEMYDTCRLVSIAWRVLGPPPRLETLRECYHVVQPLGGVESCSEALKLHGITTEDQERYGIPIAQALDELLRDVQTCEAMVAHNIHFDAGVVLSELFRLQRYADIHTLAGRRTVCTLRVARAMLNRAEFPKLALKDLLLKLTGRVLGNAHHAGADTEACAAIFGELLRRASEPPYHPPPYHQPPYRQPPHHQPPYQQPPQPQQLSSGPGAGSFWRPPAGRGMIGGPGPSTSVGVWRPQNSWTAATVAASSTAGPLASAGRGMGGMLAGARGSPGAPPPAPIPGFEGTAAAEARRLTEAACCEPDKAEPIPVPSGNSLVLQLVDTGGADVAAAQEPHRAGAPAWSSSGRLVCIAWRVLGPLPGMETLGRGFHVVRPDGFDVPADVAAQLGATFTTEVARQEGLPVREVLARLLDDAKDCTSLVTLDAPAVVGVLLGELSRLQGNSNNAAAPAAMRPVCLRRAAAMTLAPGGSGEATPIRASSWRQRQQQLMEVYREVTQEGTLPAGWAAGLGPHGAGHAAAMAAQVTAEVEACVAIYADLLGVDRPPPPPPSPSM